MTAYHLSVVIGLFTGGDGLSALGPFHLHVSPRCRRLFSVWLWVLVFVVGWCLLALVLLVLLCLFSRCAPYAPSYISYDDSSHSELKAKKARRVKKVPTPKATRAKKDRRAHTPGPSWKVARVQPKGTQNDGFSPSFLPLPPVSVFHFLPPWLIRFTAPCLFFPPFPCLP